MACIQTYLGMPHGEYVLHVVIVAWKVRVVVVHYTCIVAAFILLDPVLAVYRKLPEAYN